MESKVGKLRKARERGIIDFIVHALLNNFEDLPTSHHGNSGGPWGKSRICGHFGSAGR
jgi:hypothetical protein